MKDIMCKLGYHKYRMKQFSLTSCIMKVVTCEKCGINLEDEEKKIWEKKREKIAKHKFLP